MYLLQLGGPYLALYLWTALLLLSLVLMTVYPTFIAPLFNRFTPLPEGSLRWGRWNLGLGGLLLRRF